MFLQQLIAAAQTVLSYYSRGEYPKREAAGSSFTPQNFTLKIYDKTGTTVERTENVSVTNSNGTVSIDGLNNDAVKFAIENTTGMALVNVDVKMEPLIRMSVRQISCAQERKVRR